MDVYEHISCDKSKSLSRSLQDSPTSNLAAISEEEGDQYLRGLPFFPRLNSTSSERLLAGDRVSALVLEYWSDR